MTRSINIPLSGLLVPKTAHKTLPGYAKDRCLMGTGLRFAIAMRNQ